MARVPKWVTTRFREFLAAQEELDRLLHLSMRSIAALRGLPAFAVALADVEGTTLDPDNQQRVAALTKDAELAAREVDNGFPLLHAQAAVTIWGSLEYLVSDFVASWLANQPSAVQVEQVSKLKIRFGDFISLNEEERYYYLTDLLDRETQGNLRRGVDRFENLLEVFDLGGTVPEDTRKALWELFHVRNCLVHRRGLADRRLIQACPWLNLSAGELSRVDHAAREVPRRYDPVRPYALAAGSFSLRRRNGRRSSRFANWLLSVERRSVLNAPSVRVDAAFPSFRFDSCMSAA